MRACRCRPVYFGLSLSVWDPDQDEGYIPKHIRWTDWVTSQKEAASFPVMPTRARVPNAVRSTYSFIQSKYIYIYILYL